MEVGLRSSSSSYNVLGRGNNRTSEEESRDRRRPDREQNNGTWGVATLYRVRQHNKSRENGQREVIGSQPTFSEACNPEVSNYHATGPIQALVKSMNPQTFWFSMSELRLKFLHYFFKQAPQVIQNQIDENHTLKNMF